MGELFPLPVKGKLLLLLLLLLLLFGIYNLLKYDLPEVKKSEVGHYTKKNACVNRNSKKVISSDLVQEKVKSQY